MLLLCNNQVAKPCPVEKEEEERVCFEYLHQMHRLLVENPTTFTSPMFMLNLPPYNTPFAVRVNRGLFSLNLSAMSLDLMEKRIESEREMYNFSRRWRLFYDKVYYTMDWPTFARFDSKVVASSGIVVRHPEQTSTNAYLELESLLPSELWNDLVLLLCQMPREARKLETRELFYPVSYWVKELRRPLVNDALELWVPNFITHAQLREYFAQTLHHDDVTLWNGDGMTKLVESSSSITSCRLGLMNVIRLLLLPREEDLASESARDVDRFLGTKATVSSVKEFSLMINELLLLLPGSVWHKPNI
ncbi:hypothetical protein BASA81_000944 [Batrachochytrium salamandrivorans]|nr:hypothetical protein BASA81_000944 [Batrachochytrium salamandrivorans]